MLDIIEKVDVVGSVKYCQFAIVGHNIEWVLKGVFYFRTDALVLICSDDEGIIKLAEEIKQKLQEMNQSSTLLPIEIVIISGRAPLEYVLIVKKMIMKYVKLGYQIDFNITAGFRIWQNLTYFIAFHLREYFHSLFIIIKDLDQPYELPLNMLTRSEQVICNSLADSPKTIEEIKRYYVRKTKSQKISNAFISKYLSKLKKMDLIQERREGKTKIFSLTEMGKYYTLIEDNSGNMEG